MYQNQTYRMLTKVCDCDTIPINTNLFIEPQTNTVPSGQKKYTNCFHFNIIFLFYMLF